MNPCHREGSCHVCDPKSSSSELRAFPCSLACLCSQECSRFKEQLLFSLSMCTGFSSLFWDIRTWKSQGAIGSIQTRQMSYHLVCSFTKFSKGFHSCSWLEPWQRIGKNLALPAVMIQSCFFHCFFTLFLIQEKITCTRRAGSYTITSEWASTSTLKQ